MAPLIQRSNFSCSKSAKQHTKYQKYGSYTDGRKYTVPFCCFKTINTSKIGGKRGGGDERERESKRERVGRGGGGGENLEHEDAENEYRQDG